VLQLHAVPQQRVQTEPAELSRNLCPEIRRSAALCWCGGSPALLLDNIRAVFKSAVLGIVHIFILFYSDIAASSIVMYNSNLIYSFIGDRSITSRVQHHEVMHCMHTQAECVPTAGVWRVDYLLWSALCVFVESLQRLEELRLGVTHLLPLPYLQTETDTALLPPTGQ